MGQVAAMGCCQRNECVMGAGVWCNVCNIAVVTITQYSGVKVVNI